MTKNNPIQPTTSLDGHLWWQLVQLENQQHAEYAPSDAMQQERMHWYGQLCRRLSRLLPGQHILVLGTDSDLLSHEILHITNRENPITRITHGAFPNLPPATALAVECIDLKRKPSSLRERRFDLIIAALSVGENQLEFLCRSTLKLLAPGGKVIVILQNPWKAGHQLTRLFNRASAFPVFRNIKNQHQLHSSISALGFGQAFSFHYDFAFPAFAPRFSWALRHLSTLLENVPAARRWSRSLVIYAQAPQKEAEAAVSSLTPPENLKNAVSVVIPCHNEEPNIIPLVTELKRLYSQYLKEIILVDDNSRDRTREIILALSQQESIVVPVIRQPPNGVGLALRDGYRVATGKFILSMDCDFIQILPEFRHLFEAAAQGHDMVVGSRFSRQSLLLNYPWPKILANRSFHLLARLLLRRSFRDLTNNLKIFRRQLLDDLELTQNGFAINAELGLKPLAQGYSVKEVPVSWINRTPEMGQSSFRLLKVAKNYYLVLMEVVKSR